MDKPYRKLRAGLHKRKTTQEGEYTGFTWRVVLCLLAFLTIAFIRVYGGPLCTALQGQLQWLMQGEQLPAQAYTQSVEAFNQLCDRLIEAQADDD